MTELATQPRTDDGWAAIVGCLDGFLYRATYATEPVLTEVTGNVAELTGYRAAELTGQRARTKYRRLIPSDDLTAMDAAIAAAVREGRRWRVSYRLLGRQGGEIWVQDMGAPIQDSDGAVSALAGGVVDITHEKRSEGAMEHLLAQLRQTSESVVGETSYILEVISKLRMLALNARIEAARAGEYGKGFQIVAEEMKTLANDSGQAADRITGLIRELRGLLDQEQQVEGTAASTAGEPQLTDNRTSRQERLTGPGQGRDGQKQLPSSKGGGTSRRTTLAGR